LNSFQIKNNLNVRYNGLGVENGRTPVLGIHGASATGEIFEQHAIRFAKEGIPFFALDLPGYGQSLPRKLPERLTIGDYDEAVQNVTAWARCPVDVIGHSMGGLVSLVTSNMGAHIRRLVLINSAPPWMLLQTRIALMAVKYTPLMVLGAQWRYTENDYLTFLCNGMDEDTVQTLYKKTTPNSGWAALQMCAGFVEKPKVRAQRKLVIGTDKDRMIPPATAKKIARSISAEYRQYAGCHMTFFDPKENTQMTNDVIAWLTKK